MPNQFYYEFAPSTNAIEFQEFVKNLSKRVREHQRRPGIKPYLVLDNHAAHTVQDTKHVLESRFRCLYVPTGKSLFRVTASEFR